MCTRRCTPISRHTLAMVSGVDGGHVHQALHAHLATHLGDGFWPGYIDVRIREVACLISPANQIYHNVRMFNSVTNRIFILQFKRTKQHLPQVPCDFESHHLIMIAPIRKNHLGSVFAESIYNSTTQQSTCSEHSNDITRK